MTSLFSAALKLTALPLLAAFTMVAGQPLEKPAPDVSALNSKALTAIKQARAEASAARVDEADQVVRQALQISPQDFEARKLAIKVLLARHQFRQALDLAHSVNQSLPDDVEGWGLVADAAMALGDYAEAERTAQWMLRLRSTNPLGLQRGARLRELFGDNDGASEFWQSALQVSLADTEERAWIATQTASLSRRTGNLAQAESLLTEALKAMPAYQPALSELARVRLEQHRYDDAVAILRDRYRKVHTPGVQFELAHALQLDGHETEANALYQEFEQAALAAVDSPYNYNHELVFYYADHAPHAAEALRVAGIEASRRQDVETLHAYAWALAASGDLREARKQMDKALSVGLRDTTFFYHAGSIAARLKDASAATGFFNDVVSLSPNCEAAREARTALQELNRHAD